MKKPETQHSVTDRVLLKERAYEDLKNRIQSGEFPPHVSLSERQLSERMGMSKTPIRAALENLQTQGLVTVSPQKGILIRELSAREISELFDVRVAVEPFVAGQTARRSWTTTQRRQLKENLKQQRAAAKSEDALVATVLDIAFHRMLSAVLDNREIMIWLERCFDKLHRSIVYINGQAPGRLQKSYEDHVAIADAINDGSPENAIQSMQEHLRYGRHFLLGMELPL